MGKFGKIKFKNIVKYNLFWCDSPQIPAKNCLRNYLLSKRKKIELPLPNVVNIGVFLEMHFGMRCHMSSDVDDVV
jgi:hypothetical protein